MVREEGLAGSPIYRSFFPLNQLPGVRELRRQCTPEEDEEERSPGLPVVAPTMF